MQMPSEKTSNEACGKCCRNLFTLRNDFKETSPDARSLRSNFPFGIG